MLAFPCMSGDSDEGEGGEDEDNEEVQTATDTVADTEAVNNHSQVVSDPSPGHGPLSVRKNILCHDPGYVFSQM